MSKYENGKECFYAMGMQATSIFPHFHVIHLSYQESFSVLKFPYLCGRHWERLRSAGLVTRYFSSNGSL